MKTLKEIGEFGLIAWIKRRMGNSRPEVVRGIGDDVAVVEMGGKNLLITTDILIEGVHFERSWADPFRLGRKALAVNLSDIASMGGVPKYFLVSLGLPKQLSFPFLSRFHSGLREEAGRFQVDLIGGDTSLSRKIIINICLLGEGEKKALLFRNGARVGDDLYVSGTLGEAALGLKILQAKELKRKPKKLIDRHLSPTPRIELGQALAQKKLASAMIDVSDGLLIDASHILEESRVGAGIWMDRIPRSREYRRWIKAFSKDPYQMALNGGEDYELLFTAPPKKRAGIASLSRSLKMDITLIGEILPEKNGFTLIGRKGEKIPIKRLGFDHFK